MHTPAFIEQLERLRGARGYLDPDTYFAPASVEAARLAAGGLVALVDRMIEWRIRPRHLAAWRSFARRVITRGRPRRWDSAC